ncbi:hypothetical protein AC249_AIPGENE2740 [Exaiptasia diaphana]|nr:hypothetical protein AC249_AIPGENE2740 [Exaiptasia diaphana]
MDPKKPTVYQIPNRLKNPRNKKEKKLKKVLDRMKNIQLEECRQHEKAMKRIKKEAKKVLNNCKYKEPKKPRKKKGKFTLDYNLSSRVAEEEEAGRRRSRKKKKQEAGRKQKNLWRTTVAYDDWKLSKIDAIVLGPLEDSRDTVQLAKHLIEWDVLDDNFPYNYSSEEEEEEEEER